MFKVNRYPKNCPRIFHVEFEPGFSYNMSMFFLRYQEFYESPNPKFRNKSFTIMEFMDWYTTSFKNTEVFTYPKDWAGFNIPSESIKKCLSKIDDFNHYDEQMKKLYSQCLKESKKQNFYLIGSIKGEIEFFEHKMAHGLYYTNKQYNKEMNDLLKLVDNKYIQSMYNFLTNMGYTESVLDDECQAYFSTGWFGKNIPKKELNKICKPFIEVFNKYYNDLI